ncbi:hypothetical protein C4D60_Mb00t00840 [Musa balbisiana]|uniref:Uncharacterized protein n=1 Tax=Musa balbisiana TaxID=52838 RepID=A0A4S8I6P8_MUSBA|nr:hypothetical protein C4D60_Mb00t00840 [Musa balbisiana]
MLLRRSSIKAGRALDCSSLLSFLVTLNLGLASSRLWLKADKKIVVYETTDSAELIETWSMAIVGYVIDLKTSYFSLGRWYCSGDQTPIASTSPKGDGIVVAIRLL